MRQEVIMLRGLPGSGKSTWAREFVAGHPLYQRVNRDDLRAMVATPYASAREVLVARLRDACVVQALLAGYSVIVDDTNLQEHHEYQIRALAAPFDVPVRIVAFDTPIEECIRRDALRPQPVGAEAIRRLAGGI